MMKTILCYLIQSCLFLLLIPSVHADTGTATLDKLRVYDTQNEKFVEDTSEQDPVDGGGFSSRVVGEAASASYQGVYYTAITRQDLATPEITHIYLLRNNGVKFEGWDHDKKIWTTALGNMDPIDSDLSLGFTAANPAMSIDSEGRVYIAYTRTIAGGSDRKVFMSVYDPEQNDVFIYDDLLNGFVLGGGGLTNNLASPQQARSSIGNNSSASTTDADDVTPAIAIDSNDDVYIAFSTEMTNGADAKIFLTRFDSSEGTAYIWDDGVNGGNAGQKGEFTNNLRAPASELDSASVNVANFETSTSPSMAIDSQDNVYIAYLQQGIAGANNRIWLTKYDKAADDVLIWDDGAGMMNENTRALNDELVSAGNNSSNNTDAFGSPSIGIDSNDDVYITYIQQSENGTDPKIWLSKYDSSADDMFIWDANSGGADVGAFTNDQQAPNDELDSFGPNVTAAADAIDSPTAGTPSADIQPALLIDKQDNVWVSYVHQVSTLTDTKVFLSKYDAAQDDVFLWDDAASQFTNNQSSLTDNMGISLNNANDQDATGNTSMALAENGDIYIAFASELIGQNNEHVFVSKVDVSENDVLIWDAANGEFTNDLSSITDFVSSFDNASADGDTSSVPVMTPTSKGIYINYLHRPNGNLDRTHVARIGTPDQTLCVPIKSQNGAISLICI